MDIRKLKELVRLMTASDLTELDLRDKDEQVTIRRASPQVAPQVIHAPAVVHHAAPAATPAPAAPAAAAPAKPAADEGLVAIESPMVGTFYASPSPDKPPFVAVGAQVGPNSVVCLVEAMKIFNEIKAERSGTIVKMMVQSGQAVEFGQPLFMIKPS
ncbi:MAG: acetyl-CoA carboxylase biotin carboxyl carrier protein [Planctomycetes bacterium]|nr:acetyl-CoA carboxylase biotin carboxyl carrier protein [Planctomycetota bacterium]